MPQDEERPRMAAAETEHECLHGATALVTGGPGFIGSALCAELAHVGAVVHSVSRRAQGPSAAQHHWPLDLADAAAVAQLVRTVRPDYVFHLASHVMGAPDLQHVLPAFHGNLQTTVNLLHALTEIGCRSVITTGSLVEPDPGVAQKIPSSPYAAAKWASSSYARMFHALYGLPVSIARVFMVYGPGQQDESKLIPYTIRCLQRGEVPHITSGRHQIDWIFVSDVVDGLLKLATAADVAGESVDLGTGAVITTRQLVDTVCELMHASVRPAYGARPDRPLEPLRVARPEESLRLIGWKPRIGLRDGLQRTIDWYQERPRERASA
ncbi:MAG: NAD-dependent epimerase/dehydratase family protein [Luteitalea sp.]|nr:NAD-dependent epimerase/dehydratase family protein [Luteitalea sp.]